MVFATEKKLSKESQSEEVERGSKFKQDLQDDGKWGKNFHKAKLYILKPRVGSMASTKNWTLMVHLSYEKEHWNLFSNNTVTKNRR